MRKFGLLLIVAGIAGFVYCSGRLAQLDPAPAGLSVGAALDHPTGRWVMARYAAGGVAAFGVLLALFPKGR